MKQTLGNLERQLFAYAQMRGLRVLRTGDLAKAIGISTKQESKLFTRLSKAGMIAQVRRGLYLIPQRLPLDAIRSAGRTPLIAMGMTGRFPTASMPTTIGCLVSEWSDPFNSRSSKLQMNGLAQQ